jgi:ABC-type multidrug transport system fused ATPase/permease subunit
VQNSSSRREERHCLWIRFSHYLETMLLAFSMMESSPFGWLKPPHVPTSPHLCEIYVKKLTPPLVWQVPVPGTSPDAPKVLLKDVSGFAKPGYITTIMGGPGAGKRILLDVLAGQQKGHITGDILVNGFDRVESTFKRISGYVCLDALF